MILTISTTFQPATDLGYLLRKNPDRYQSFEVFGGVAHVFYPEASEARCTAALMIEIDPIDLVRHRGRGARTPTGGGIDEYVNDRPYAATSLLSVALGKVFASARTGKSVERPELAATPMPLEITMSALPSDGGPELISSLFQPLGYVVEVSGEPLDSAFASWGESRYHTVRLTTMALLSEVITHLTVLIPALDGEKHYWVGDDEVDKLLHRAGDWLAVHPQRDLITRRYLRDQRALTRDALRRLSEDDDLDPDARVTRGDSVEAGLERPMNLNQRRIQAVVAALHDVGASRIADLGCGEGRLLEALLADGQFASVLGLDVSVRALERAAKRLHFELMAPRQRERSQLIHGSLTYRDDRIAGWDAATAVEVIEHLDPYRLDAFASSVFGHAKPTSVVVTTPNAEYNALFPSLPAGNVRHPDHRFEWTRAEFADWAQGITTRFGYSVEIRPVGDEDSAARRSHADGGVQALNIKLPELSLVVLVGASSSGKSLFARRHFKPTEVISSDACRALAADDENALDVNKEAFGILETIASTRLGLRRLAVIDATNVQRDARKPLLALAKDNDVLAVAIVFDLPERVLQDRLRERTDRNMPAHVIHNQTNQLRRSLRDLQKEGFRYVHILRTQEDVDAVTIERQRLWTDRRDEHGPFDMVGDIHGCHDELIQLLGVLGYVDTGEAHRHPDGRRAVFLGDLVDRGPATPAVLRTVMAMVREGSALCVPGNHDIKLMKALQGRQVKVSHGLAESLEQFEAEPPDFKRDVVAFVDGLISHLVLDDGNLVVAHAGMNEKLQGRASGRVRSFALFGETTGETDEFGLPVRYNWAGDYRGKAMVVYGHTPVPEAEWLNNTICLDTGCVFGGKLTALRYPENELVSVPAARMYYEPVRPLIAERSPSEQRDELLLDITDVLGRRAVETRLAGNVTVGQDHAAAALEVISRFAVDPRWLIYLPPTMSPPATTTREGFLEYPTEAFDAYRSAGITSLICEEKHMGSRAIAIVGRDSGAIERRFRINSAIGGVLYTRTGRRFFADEFIERQVMERLRHAVTRAGLWDELTTDWVLLDMELMPWSAKAGELLLTQYAAVGSAAEQSFAMATQALESARDRGVDVRELLDRTSARSTLIEGYRNAYRHFCWDVNSVDDLRIAPFHLLASEGAVHVDKDHAWHMSALARMTSEDDPLVIATANRTVDLADPESEAAAVAWWETLTGAGGEGMVIKPMDFLARGKRGLVQPAVKCRGREYLRIIYGPEYTLPDNLARLRERSLGLKRSLALREFALGVEAIERFVRHDGLYRVHECVFGVLAMESEPVDPRL